MITVVNRPHHKRPSPSGLLVMRGFLQQLIGQEGLNFAAQVRMILRSVVEELRTLLRRQFQDLAEYVSHTLPAFRCHVPSSPVHGNADELPADLFGSPVIAASTLLSHQPTVVQPAAWCCS